MKPPREVIEYYDRVAEESRLATGRSRLEFERTKELITRVLPASPTRIVDVGGAAGPYSAWLAELGHEVHLVDLSERLVGEARRLNAILKAPIASLEVADARSLPQADGFADIVLVMGPLYHLTESTDARSSARAPTCSVSPRSPNRRSIYEPRNPIGDVSLEVQMPRMIRSSCIAILATLTASSSVHAAQAKAPVPGGACSLITKEEVAAALAVSVTGPKETNVADAAGPGTSVSACGYEGSGLQSFTLSVWRLSPAVAPVHKAMCAKKTKDGLDGLGDLACWYDAKHQELHAYKGTTYVSVELKRSGDTTDAIKDVMKKALERLK